MAAVLLLLVVGAAPVSYQLTITNTMPHIITVAFRDSAEHRLGDLDAGQSHTYTITDPASPHIQVLAHMPAMGSDDDRDVTLRADSAVVVAF